MKLLHSHLIKRRQRVKINNTDNSWSEILVGVPQGFILGPLLIFFLCDLFLFVPDIDIANYVDHDTPHAINKHRETVLTDPEQESNILFELV